MVRFEYFNKRRFIWRQVIVLAYALSQSAVFFFDKQAEKPGRW